jgi:hypothetical protein
MLVIVQTYVDYLLEGVNEFFVLKYVSFLFVTDALGPLSDLRENGPSLCLRS